MGSSTSSTGSDAVIFSRSFKLVTDLKQHTTSRDAILVDKNSQSPDSFCGKVDVRVQQKET